MKCSMVNAAVHTHLCTHTHAVRFHSIDLSGTEQHQCEENTHTHKYNLYRLCFPALKKRKVML